MSDSVRPHRWQPTRLPRPWDSPGKNTGGGCHFLLQCMKVESENWKWTLSVVSDSSRPYGLQPTRLPCPCDFPGKSTGVGCHCLLWTFPVREMQIKTTWAITSHLSEWPSATNLQTINAGKSVEKRGPSCVVGGNVNWYSHYREQYGNSLQSWE